jgi:DNA repair protein RadA/Sms
VEVQALVSQSELIPPRRVVNGLDRNRLALVLAVLARHGGVALGGADVFVNVVGGVRVDEPGADLAVALAVASASRGVTLGPPDAAAPLAAFGELGLTGELRWVAHPERRIAEARRFGLDPVIAPRGTEATEVATLRGALDAAFASAPQRSRAVAAA